MSLTSTSVLVLFTCAAILLPFGVAAIRATSWRMSLVRWIGIALCQVMAIAAVGVAVNRQYGFYSSWSDLAGTDAGAPATIQTSDLSPDAAGDGSTMSFVMHGKPGQQGRALAWLPPGYSDPQNAHRRYPVLVILPGYANTVESTYENLNFGKVASAMLAHGQAKPFIAVFASYQTVQGRDMECTNLRGGAQDQTFLTKDIPASIKAHLRTSTSTSDWVALGWSTGGYCATKALYAQPSPWGSAVSMGGYFEALTDFTTGNLYPTKHDRLINSPSELYRRYQMPSTRLLIVSSRQDRDAWASSASMGRLTKADPNVADLWIPSGGHNFATYSPYLPQMISWAFTARVAT